jgi:hypothetical protein
LDGDLVIDSEIKKTMREVVTSVAPILAVVIILLFLIEAPSGDILNFLLGGALTVIGITLFLLGVRIGMLPMGETIGAELPKRQSLIFIVIVVFLLSFLVTVAEPDVRVLTSVFNQASNGEIDRDMLIFVIAFGVSFFMATSVMRIIYNIPIKYLFTIGYAIVVILSFFAPPEFLAISYDAGGVTTGPITVPVILALGLGVVSVLGGKSALSDGFGLIGLASIGPILGIMITGVLIG